MLLRNVEIFCDVVSRRSFSKAAAAHNVSQSSVSQAVHMLERQLGALLIDRSKRPLELTSAGQAVFDGCRQLLESFHELKDRVQLLNDKVVGRVRVAAIYSVGLLQMDEYVRRYQALYPDVALHLDYLHPDEVYDSILNDECDIGLVSFPRVGGEISHIPWQKQEMVLVVAADHRLARCESISVHELNGEKYVGFREELAIRKKVDRWLKEAKVAVNIVHEFDNIENIKRAVEIGSGVALLPIPTVRRETDMGSLKAVRLEGVGWYRPLGIVHRRNKTFSTAASKFVELLQADAPTCRSAAQGGGDANGKRSAEIGREAETVDSRQ
jgi:DNA-binding transcriptional LysR family regulator